MVMLGNMCRKEKIARKFVTDLSSLRITSYIEGVAWRVGLSCLSPRHYLVAAVWQLAPGRPFERQLLLILVPLPLFVPFRIFGMLIYCGRFEFFMPGGEA